MQAACRVIVKLGGSAITDKQQRQTLKPGELHSIAADLARLHTELHQQHQQQGTPAPGIVVVHGAGSFGHFEAHEYQLTKPAAAGQTQERLREGFARTRRAVTALNHATVAALVDAGVPAVSVSPCGAWFPAQDSQHDDAAGIAAVQAVLAAGLVPVLHGDGIVARTPPPGQLVPAILSGDTIISRLAEVLQPDWVAFLSDVPGLLTKPPSEPDARLLHEVLVATSSSSSGSGEGALSWTASGEAVQLSAAEHDTTGGMATKINAAAAIAARGCPVVLAQAGTHSGSAAVLRGPDAFSGPAAAAAGVRGTVVRLRQA